jgi:uncharacterized membrane protein (UPF0182 family)
MPQDYSVIQTTLWGAYHVSDTENFYQRQPSGAVSQDPGRTGQGAPT